MFPDFRHTIEFKMESCGVIGSVARLAGPVLEWRYRVCGRTGRPGVRVAL